MHRKNKSSLTEISVDEDDVDEASYEIESVYISRGSPCPHCGKGRLDYNGLLDLECDRCGYVLSGGAGCT